MKSKVSSNLQANFHRILHFMIKPFLVFYAWVMYFSWICGASSLRAGRRSLSRTFLRRKQSKFITGNFSIATSEYFWHVRQIWATVDLRYFLRNTHMPHLTSVILHRAIKTRDLSNPRLGHQQGFDLFLKNELRQVSKSRNIQRFHQICIKRQFKSIWSYAWLHQISIEPLACQVFHPRQVYKSKTQKFGGLRNFLFGMFKTARQDHFS